MSFSAIGDLAASYQLRRDSARISSDLNRLAQELSSGRKSDVSVSSSGDFGALPGIERSLTALDAFNVVGDEAKLLGATTQQALASIQDSTRGLSNRLLVASATDLPSAVDTVGQDAAEVFASMISTLNSSVAGRFIFSGAAVDRPALAAADDMLAALSAAIAADTTAADISNTVDTWFAPGGGYDTLGYQGSNDPLQPVKLNDRNTAQFEIKANDGEVRGILAAAAKAALLDQGALAGNATERKSLANLAAVDLLGRDTSMVQLRAEVGVFEEKVDNALSRNASERSALEIARSEITGADPFQTATELQATEQQLQTFFTITARLSQLNLTSFLR